MSGSVTQFVFGSEWVCMYVSAFLNMSGCASARVCEYVQVSVPVC